MRSGIDSCMAASFDADDDDVKATNGANMYGSRNVERRKEICIGSGLDVKFFSWNAAALGRMCSIHSNGWLVGCLSVW